VLEFGAADNATPVKTPVEFAPLAQTGMLPVVGGVAAVARSLASVARGLTAQAATCGKDAVDGRSARRPGRSSYT
jgi:hypothetical protein